MSDVISEARSKIAEAITEIVQESTRLERALIALDGGSGSNGARKPAGATTEPRRRKQKRAKRGERREQFLAAVRAQPGITVAQMSKMIESAPQPLYTLGKKLEKDGEVIKDGSGYKAGPISSKPTKAKAKPKAAKAKAKKEVAAAA